VINNIINSVVKKNRCIGCGVCDAICPINILEMRFSTTGIYQPIEHEGCLEKCTLCLNVCPFLEVNKHELSIADDLYADNHGNFHPELGFYFKTYEIHKNQLSDRLISASGGAGHSLLRTLLLTNEIDAVLTVESNNDPDKLFKFSLFKNSNELIKACGSVYYPTELSEVIRYVMNHDGSYVITALPCYAKAIRLAQEKNKKLRKRIRYIIGLVCGQMKSKEFTHRLAKFVIGTERLVSVKYRVKQPNQPANNFAYEFIGENGSTGIVGFTENDLGPSRMWTSRMFTPMACNSCTDVFAQCADIVLMDAWLPQYTKDYRGHTFVIVRNKEIDRILQSVEDITINPIQSKAILKSQKNVIASKQNVVFGSFNPLIKSITKIKIEIQNLSSQNYETNTKDIQVLLKKLNRLELMNKITTLPARAINKIFNQVNNLIN
jgi:coenzyme F420-reducing hydrogenase beta subunit